MKIVLEKETNVYGEVKFWAVIKDSENNTKEVKGFKTQEDAEIWIDEFRYKIQEAKTELLKSYDLD